MKNRKMALVVVIIEKSAPRAGANRKRRDTQEQMILNNSDRILVAVDAAKVNDHIEVVLKPC